jgi:prefoldin subunit 5
MSNIMKLQELNMQKQCYLKQILKLQEKLEDVNSNINDIVNVESGQSVTV